MPYQKPQALLVGAAINAIQSASKLVTDSDNQIQPSDPAYQADE